MPQNNIYFPTKSVFFTWWDKCYNGYLIIMEGNWSTSLHLPAVNENISINLLLCALLLPLMHPNSSDKNTEEPATSVDGGMSSEMCCMPMIFVLTKSIADEYVVLT